MERDFLSIRADYNQHRFSTLILIFSHKKYLHSYFLFKLKIIIFLRLATYCFLFKALPGFFLFLIHQGRGNKSFTFIPMFGQLKINRLFISYINQLIMTVMSPHVFKIVAPFNIFEKRIRIARGKFQIKR